MPAAHDQGFTVWLTGLSGAGKSTIGELLVARLKHHGRRVQLLDGDVIREKLGALGFTRQDREFNVRRIGWLCGMLNSHGVDAVAAVISPYRSTRQELRALIPTFVEVFVDCPLEVAAHRDPKGLYRRAFAGELTNFTGVSDTYEPPTAPDVVCRTGSGSSAVESADLVLRHIIDRGLLTRAGPDGR